MKEKILAQIKKLEMRANETPNIAKRCFKISAGMMKSYLNWILKQYF